MASASVAEEEESSKLTNGAEESSKKPWKKQKTAAERERKMKFGDVVNVGRGADEGERTADVQHEEGVDFGALLLCPAVLEGLRRAQFRRPSPVQLAAVPLGRLGVDLVVQAKSGTGKTAVFAIVALEMVQLKNSAPQVFVLTPTREIAEQCAACLSAIGSTLRKHGLRVGLFIGGTSLQMDRLALKGACQIVVGTPGRLCQLVQKRFLALDSIRFFVLDEADKMMDDSYQSEVNWLWSQMPVSKQVCVFSATYPDELDELLSRYMTTPTLVRLDAADVQLLGVKQFVTTTTTTLLSKTADSADGAADGKDEASLAVKLDRLHQLLSRVAFSQCLVFCNYQDKCEAVCERLNERGWDAQYIAGSLAQAKRSQLVKELRQSKYRLLVTTDLTARGIDAPNVNLVINLESPRDAETYFHRIGRAGRFGGYGAAVTIITSGLDDVRFFRAAKSAHFNLKCLSFGNSTELPAAATVPSDLCTNQSFWDAQPPIDCAAEFESAVAARRRQNASPSSDEVVFYGEPSLGAEGVEEFENGAKQSASYEDDLAEYRRLRATLPAAEKVGKAEKMREKRPHYHPDPKRMPETDFSDAQGLRDRFGTSGGSLRDQGDGPYAYSREDLMHLGGMKADLRREVEVKEDKKLATPVDEVVKQDTPPPPVEKDWMSPDAFLSRFREQGVTKISLATCLTDPGLSPLIQQVEVDEPLSALFQFKRKRRHCYLRGDFLDIRRALPNAKVLAQYMASKWDMSAEPFLPILDKSEARQDSSTKATKPATCGGVKEKATRPPKRRYNRSVMIGIQHSMQTERMRAMAAAKWDLTVEPFVADLTLRCSYSRQCRLRQGRDMAERARELQLRTAEVNARPTVAPRAVGSVDEAIFEKVFDLEAMHEHLRELEQAPGRGLGPVVEPRPKFTESAARLLKVEQMLRSSQKAFELAVRDRVEGRVPETELQTVLKFASHQGDKPAVPKLHARYNKQEMLAIWQEVAELSLPYDQAPWKSALEKFDLLVDRSFTDSAGSSRSISPDTFIGLKGAPPVEVEAEEVEERSAEKEEDKEDWGAYADELRAYYEKVSAWHGYVAGVAANRARQSQWADYLSQMISGDSHDDE